MTPPTLASLVKPPPWSTAVQLDEIGFRTLQSRVPGFWPGRGWVRCSPSKIVDSGSECPVSEGDGICVARTALGAASGGQSLAAGVLVVGWKSSDVLGATESKVRLRAAFVLGPLTLRDALPALKSNLTRANLTRADLTGADLYGANLYGANLAGAIGAPA